MHILHAVHIFGDLMWCATSLIRWCVHLPWQGFLGRSRTVRWCPGQCTEKLWGQKNSFVTSQMWSNIRLFQPVSLFFLQIIQRNYNFSQPWGISSVKRGERDVDVCSADLLCLETEATDGEHRQRFLNDEFYVVFFHDFFSQSLPNGILFLLVDATTL